ncbi:MAG: gliding motility-associated C-terminal domain-containing protein [Bacteroidetes bacterium]|nr:MAG: gliding motility-associated C-terminal domain-containing protein [Bacteroidota bacterium]
MSYLSNSLPSGDLCLLNMIRFYLLVSLLQFWVATLLRAQECVADPGPAVFFEDFGSGPNPGLAPSSGSIGFIFGTTNPNGYIVANRSGREDQLWHDGPDHTEGDTDGYMLLFNASDGPSAFYRSTFTGLCPTTDYIFTCYLANLMVPTSCIGNPVHPEVRFTAIDPSDETVLLSTTTRQILVRSRLEWHEFSFRFRTRPNQSEVYIQLTNEAPGGCGNALGMDDLSLSLCNIQQTQTLDLCDTPDGRIQVGSSIYTTPGTYLDALPLPNSCNDTLITTIINGEQRRLPSLRYTFCQGDVLEVAGRTFTSSASFVDTLPGPSADCPFYQAYEISAQAPQTYPQDIILCPGESIRVGTKVYAQAGVYIDSLLTAAGCDSVVITSVQTPTIQVEVIPDILSIELGQRAVLNASVQGTTDFVLTWQGPGGLSCTDCASPLLVAQASGPYQLIATDLDSGCSDSAVVVVSVLNCEEVFIPNAFSPNFDQFNDQLELFTEDCFTRLISWRIFDRWGAQVYEVIDNPLSGHRFPGWDGFVRGQPAPQGVYSYQLLLERDNGTLKKVSGEVVLLR